MVSIRPFRYAQTGILIAAVVLVGIFALAFHTVRSFRQASDSLLRTSEIRLHLAEALTLLKDIHLATRNHLTSGDEQVLAGRNQQVRDLERTLARLQERIPPEAPEQAMLARLTQTTRNLLAEYDRYIELRRTSGLAAVTARLADGEGKRLGDELRAAGAELQGVITRRAEEPLRIVRSDTSFTLNVLAGGMALAVALVGTAVYVVRRDFRLREEAARAARQQAEEIRDLYNLAPCGYHSVDAAGRFVAVNDTELGWLGYTREELLGRTCRDTVLAPASHDAHETAFQALRSGGPIQHLELEFRRKDGTTFPAAVSASAIRDAAGRFVATRASVFDLTERKQGERQLRELNASLQARSADLEAANRELETFSYSVSHDLRAPLRHIDYFSTALQKHLPPEHLDAKARRHLMTIASSARSMGQLIDDLLSFARIARTELRRTRVNLDEIVQETRQGLQAEVHGRTIIWDVAALPDVEGDPALLRQVFANVLGNAVKYTRGRTEARITVTAEPGSNGVVTIVVRDNGAGFDMKYADKLFGVFQRLHSPAEFEGTGVGLANVRRIIERHGGRIWAEAGVDRGAAFHFTLPARTTTPALQPA